MVPAYLSRGPPVLQHPERVVPLSEYERFEPHYQPNVALAPIPAHPLSLMSPSLFPHHRHYYDRRRYCMASPSQHKERHLSSPSLPTIKSEKKAPPSPGEEDASAAVTSSTVNAEAAETETAAPAASPTSDSDNDASAPWSYPNLLDYDLPPQVQQLIHHLISENAYLRRELARLSTQDEKKADTSAADSTEGNKEEVSEGGDTKETPVPASATTIVATEQ